MVVNGGCCGILFAQMDIVQWFVEWKKTLIGGALVWLVTSIVSKLIYDFWFKDLFGRWLARTSDKRAKRRVLKVMIKITRLKLYQLNPLDALADAINDVYVWVLAIFTI